MYTYITVIVTNEKSKVKQLTLKEAAGIEDACIVLVSTRWLMRLKQIGTKWTKKIKFEITKNKMIILDIVRNCQFFNDQQSISIFITI